MSNAIVTGANRGIGLEFCRVLTDRGYAVTALCRQSNDALNSLPVRVVDGYDVTDGDAIDSFAGSLAPTSIDLLINNAGILQGMSLARDLQSREIVVAILHPGYVRTDMTRQSGLIDVEQSVAGLLERISALAPENSGSFWHSNGDTLPW